MAVDVYAPLADAVVETINLTFAPESIVAIHDQLHEALGTDGPMVGVSPLREMPVQSNRLAQNTWIQIQFFDTWEKEIDPTMEVDPRIITGYHARLKNALRTTAVAATGGLWYFSWEGTEYPRDPTGNNTRFVMTLMAWSNNTHFVETTS